MDNSNIFGGVYMNASNAKYNAWLTIEEEKLETIKGNKGEEKKPVIYFIEEERGLVINRTNNQILVEKLGTGSWVGAKVMLGKTKVNMNGTLKDSIIVTDIQTRRMDGVKQ